MKILVTGAGSLIGHGVLRSLRQIPRKDFTVVTADPDHRAAGHWLGDHGVTIPLARDNNYIDSLKEIISQHKIDVVFVGTDPELLKISNALDQLKTTVVISKPNVIEIGDDKWKTVQFLKANGFSYPDSALADDPKEVRALVERVGFPLIAKPRIGARSAGVSQVKSEKDLAAVPTTGYVLQELLPEGPGEFTAGTMTYNGKCYSQVIFRRDLKDGNTYRAYTYSNASHQEFLKTLSEKMPGVYGPLNFQYRLKNDKPTVFEINSRFSGTTPLRTAIGINEVEMAVDFVRNGTVTTPKQTLNNVAILRTWSDIIVPIDQLDMFADAKELDSPSATYFPFMK
ncbi:MAG TPA: ATP-grasp domain-containing protein [Cyclobacteriaceae bacterium]|nr:ATP-grasp domain-containing protein [Cyclobacteriaceae bacterium]